MTKLLWVTWSLFLFAAVSVAQNTPQAEFSAGYSGLYILKGYTIWNNGGSASAAVNINNWLGVVGDFGGYLGHVPQDLVGETYVFGPRFSYRQADKRVVPFAQALFGGSHFSQNTGGITGGGTQFTFAIGGGVDLVSAREGFALRPQVDFFGIQSQGAITPSIRLSIGIVYRIGKK